MLEIDEEKSSGIFQKNIIDVLDFLSRHNIISNQFICFLKHTCGGFVKYNVIFVNSEAYSIDIIFGKSKEKNYDLVGNNQLMNIDTSKFVAIGSFLGDDLIGFKPNDESVYFCYLDDIEFNHLIKLSDDFDSFLQLIK